MKKIDTFLIKTFVGPFILTFVVVVFILLTQYMLKYFDDFVGKGLGFEVFAELLTYFSINMTPVALPLAILLSSLMTFGNLGEHSELTAIKASGVSLLRALNPLFLFVLVIAFLGFLSNNYVVPRANLKAYSLLYDIKQKKPSLDLQEGVFYAGIKGYRIKVNEKLPDDETIKDIIIYDHTQGSGNTKVILADSGKMYTIGQDRYLILELFNGNNYQESGLSNSARRSSNDNPQYVRTHFIESKLRFDLADFAMKRTDVELFAQHRKMKNMRELNQDIDSMEVQKEEISVQAFSTSLQSYTYHLKDGSIQAPKLPVPATPYDTFNTSSVSSAAIEHTRAASSLSSIPESRVHSNNMPLSNTSVVSRPDTTGIFKNRKSINALKAEAEPKPDPAEKNRDSTRFQPQNPPFPSVTEYDTALIDQIDRESENQDKMRQAIEKSLTQCRYIKSKIEIEAKKTENLNAEINKHEIERGKKITQAISCIIMFLIGAPLGAIIKRGGLGIPVLVSISFFIVFYVLTITSEKWANENIIAPTLANWIPNIILLPFGIVFLMQARIDARIFETDFYRVLIDRIKQKLIVLKNAHKLSNVSSAEK